MSYKVKEVGVRDRSFDRVGITKDKEQAICEYIWNGFEAGATQVEVGQVGNDLRDAMAIRISDNGCGIYYDNLEDTFGAFLASSKSTKGIRIRPCDNKGKGRFSYTSFTSEASWNTIFDDNGEHKKYSITLSSDKRQDYRCSPLEKVDEPCGTTVEMPLANSEDWELLSYQKMKPRLLEEFAWYLYLKKSKGYKLNYCGNEVNYGEHIDDTLSESVLLEFGEKAFDLNIIVWKNKTENISKIYYMTEDDIIFNEPTSFNNNTVGFYHAAFVTSSFFSKTTVLQKEAESTFLPGDDGLCQ